MLDITTGIVQSASDFTLNSASHTDEHQANAPFVKPQWSKHTFAGDMRSMGYAVNIIDAQRPEGLERGSIESCSSLPVLNKALVLDESFATKLYRGQNSTLHMPSSACNQHAVQLLVETSKHVHTQTHAEFFILVLFSQTHNALHYATLVSPLKVSYKKRTDVQVYCSQFIEGQASSFQDHCQLSLQSNTLFPAKSSSHYGHVVIKKKLSLSSQQIFTNYFSGFFLTETIFNKNIKDINIFPGGTPKVIGVVGMLASFSIESVFSEACFGLHSDCIKNYFEV